jgi:hypothetical protein
VKLGDDAIFNERNARLGDIARDDESIFGHDERSFPARGHESRVGRVRNALP